VETFLIKNSDWDFFINLSGSDYPLLHPKHQRSILSSGNRSANYFNVVSKEESWGDKRYGNMFADESLSFTLNERTKILNLGRSNPVYGKTDGSFSYVKSEAWMINSRSFVKYATGSSGSRKLLAASASAICSDEIFFVTLAYNSKFNETIVGSAMREIFWNNENTPGIVKHGISPHDVDQKLNGTWYFLKKIRKSKMFFVRKFKSPNSGLMDIIDRMHNNEIRVEHTKQFFTRLTENAHQRNMRTDLRYILS